MAKKEVLQNNTVAIIGALDTKGESNKYLKQQLAKFGINSIVVDVGILGEPHFKPDISASEVAATSGVELEELRKRRDRSLAITLMGQGASEIVRKLYSEKKINGAIAIGGSTVTYIGGVVMRSLPIGSPKVLISTIATIDRQQKPFDGIGDTMVMNSLVVASDLNSILKMVIQKAAITLAGLVKEAVHIKQETKPRVALSLYGITSPCVIRTKEILDQSGYETFLFHSTGLGGRVMEDLIEEGFFAGVADITIAEVTHEFLGVYPWTHGPGRLERLAQSGIPSIVTMGGMDVINFTPPETMPEKYKNRKFHMHNPSLRVVRTSVEENQILGRIIASRLNKSVGNTTLLIPQKGVSINDVPGGLTHDPKADGALFDAVKENIAPHIKLLEMDNNINDPAFADKIAALLIEAMQQEGKSALRSV